MSEGAGSALRDRPPFSYLLVHSPLVGPRSWEPVAAVLRARGVPAVVPGLSAALAAAVDRHDALATAVDGLDSDRSDPVQAAAVVGNRPSWLVAVHSGAGALVPSLVERLV